MKAFNVLINVNMSCFRAPWQNGPYKKNTQREQHKNSQKTKMQHTFSKNYFFVFFGFFYFCVLFMISYMISS